MLGHSIALDTARATRKAYRVAQEDADLIEALVGFRRAFETRGADPDWHPSEEGVCQDLAAGLRSALGPSADFVQYEHPTGASRIDLWVASSRLAIEVKLPPPDTQRPSPPDDAAVWGASR